MKLKDKIIERTPVSLEDAGDKIKGFLNDDNASMDDKIINITIALILVGVVLVPIGLKTILNVNQTDIGIEAGSTLSVILDNIPLIALIVVFMILLSEMKRG